MRTGEFSRGSHSYGASMSIVKPRNNDPGEFKPPDIDDPRVKAMMDQEEDLNERIYNLLQSYKNT